MKIIAISLVLLVSSSLGFGKDSDSSSSDVMLISADDSSQLNSAWDTDEEDNEADLETTNLSAMPLKDRERVLNALQSNLLTMFGLPSRPKPSRKIPIPQYMWDLYQQHTQSHGIRNRVKSRNIQTADTVRSFYHKGEYIM